MTHDEALAMLDALLDGELAPPEAREVEAHLMGCAECARVRERRLALRERLLHARNAITAPADLRRQVGNAIAGSGVTRFRPRWRAGAVVRIIGAAAALLLVASGGWWMATRGAAERELQSELLASHIRSLLPGHLTDVLSSDQHTVKPWFDGKVDFSPPVTDLAAEGFPLIGGRLDYVGGRVVAALAYGRRRHLISVFLWPASSPSSALSVPSAAPALVTRQGYHLLRGDCGAYTCWLVSDVGESDLQELVGMLRPSGSGGE
ncbi:MAG TPA: zf-HC2 domain-containing protein [Gemmatimonadales bacterium]|nr:zf-HC2 domain-containing protein [Gemmatimonadales bacterium]